MSKKEEILHKLSTEDRNYIKKKFKEREEFCIGQVESLTNLINILIEENKELNDEKFEIEAKLEEYEAIKKKYKTIFLDRFVGAKVEDARIWKEKYDQLKQQLDEKDAEVQSWKDGTMVVKLGKLEEQLAEKDEGIKDLLQEIEDMENSQNVTAIAELEKAKETALKHIRDIRDDLSEEHDEYLNQKHTIHGCSIVISDIDQQIKLLKGGK